MGALTMDGVDLTYGGVKALQDVSLHVGEGAIFGLIGPNGAGKTTCINVLTGFARPTGGRVSLNGRPLAAMPAERFRALGISRTFQAGRLFSALTVAENVAAAAAALGDRRREADLRAAELLDWIGIAAMAGRRAGTLSYADQRRAAIARALVRRPAYLLLDEPAAGMSEAEAASLGRLIRRIRDDFGTSVLLVEHNIALVLSVCEDILVLDSGMVIDQGGPGHIRDSRLVREAYLGTALDRRPPPAGQAQQPRAIA